MLAVLLGLGVALTYGTGDFLGGLATTRSRPALIVLWSQLAGLVGIVIVAPLAGGRPSARDLGTGAVAGVVGLCGLVLFYRALAGGRMAVVAPTSAVAAALVPVVLGIAGGEELGWLGAAGTTAALLGVVLVSLGEGNAAGRTTTRSARADGVLALLGGACFGVVFGLLGNVSEGSGLWPIVAQRGSSVTVLGLILLVRKQAAPPPAGTRLQTAGAGLFDTGANALFVFAARAGDLAVAGVLSSLYPVATVVLASRVLGEHIRRIQLLGIAIAIGGAVLLAI